MSVLERDHLETLDYLKGSVQRLRAIASSDWTSAAQPILALAAEIAGDVAKLEAELVEAGRLPKPANQA